MFFDAWFGQLHPGIWNRVSDLLPDRATARIVSFAAMLTETALGIGFAFRRLFPVAVWLGLVFHASLTLLANRTFGMFWFAATGTGIEPETRIRP